MNRLKDYIAPVEPIRSVERVRHDMTEKAKSVADMFFPNDKEKNKLCAEAYLIGMYDTLDLIFY